jgi:hypothetical protein
MVKRRRDESPEKQSLSEMINGYLKEIRLRMEQLWRHGAERSP